MAEIPFCIRCGKPMHVYEANPAFYICDAPNENPEKDCSKFPFLETAKNNQNENKENKSDSPNKSLTN